MRGVSGHGFHSYQDEIPVRWYESLKAPVVNGKTGMKQIGRKGLDPCSVQVHKNGKVVVFGHSLGWIEWLKLKFLEYGWSEDQSYTTVENLRVEWISMEIAVPKAGTLLPRGSVIDFDFGVAIVRDDTPEKKTLEIKLSFPKLKEHLRIPELESNQSLIVKDIRYLQALVRKNIAALQLFRLKEGSRDNYQV